MLQQLVRLFQVNWAQTLRLNFRLLPWRDALRLPVVVRGRLAIPACSGQLILPPGAPFATLTIGSRHETYTASAGKAQLTLLGRWRVLGPVHVGVDSCIYVGRGALLEMGADCFVARDSQIHCFHEVRLGCRVLTGEVYITDSAAHSIMRGSETKPMLGSVVVGDDCYLGFRVSLLKGCVIPPRSVVGTQAVCCRDYSRWGSEALFLVGCPADVKETGVKPDCIV